MNMRGKLKAIRDKLNISQTELGEILGMDQTSISNIEVGRRNPSFAILLKLNDIVQKHNIPISLLPEVTNKDAGS